MRFKKNYERLGEFPIKTKPSIMTTIVQDFDITNYKKSEIIEFILKKEDNEFLIDELKEFKKDNLVNIFKGQNEL